MYNLLTRRPVLVVVLLALLCSAVNTFAEPENHEALDAAQQSRIAQLVDNLASSHEAIRKKAAEELNTLGFAVLEPLQQAAQDNTRPKRAEAARQYLAKLDKHDFKILDAFGSPIAGAKVVITPADQSGDVTLTTNPLGNINYRHPRELNPRQGSARLRVEHVEYGIADLRVSLRNAKPTTLWAPLLADDHEAADRAARGRVVDPEGKPVPGVLIRCGSVRTPGEGLINGRDAVAVTDQDGAFRFYIVQTQQFQERRGELIPPGSDAVCWMDPPDEAGLWRWAGRIGNTEPAMITLSRPTLTRTIKVESPDGGFVTEPRHEGQTWFVHESEAIARNLPLDLDRLAGESKLMPGTYRLTYHGVEYPPIKVDADSPDTLVFRLPPPITYTGQVIDGITGEPIAGALVFGWSGTRNKGDTLATLTDEQWDALHDMPTESIDDHPALAPIKKGFTLQQATRTDAEGRYELTQPIDEKFWGIMAVDQDRLPIYESVLSRFTPDNDHRAKIKAIPLFPAAKAVVMPQVGEVRLSVGYKWTYGKMEARPPWMGAMRQLNQGRQRGFRRTSWLKNNEEQAVLVPAGVPIRLRFSTPYADDWSDFTYSKTVTLVTGQTWTMDEAVTFEPVTQRTVRVVDRHGKPVEGIPVRRLYHSTNTGSVPHNTDAEGLARLYVNPGETGRFYVSMRDAPSVDFDSDADDPDKVYELRMSDAQIKRALGQD